MAKLDPELAREVRGQSFTIDPDLLMVDSNDNSRRWDDTPLEELMASLIEDGQLQDVLVRRVKDDKTGDYIVDDKGRPVLKVFVGFRRTKAARQINQEKLLGEDSKFLLRIRVLDAESELEAFILSVTENNQRENPNPMDDAYAIQRMTAYFGLTASVIADKFRKTPSWISQRVALNRLPLKIQKLVAKRIIGATTAYDMVISDMTPEQMEELAKQAVKDGKLARETVRRMVRESGPEDDEKSAGDSAEQDEPAKGQQTEETTGGGGKKNKKGGQESEEGDGTLAKKAVKKARTIKEVLRFFEELSADYPEDGSPLPMHLMAADIVRWCRGLLKRDAALKAKIEQHCKSR